MKRAVLGICLTVVLCVMTVMPVSAQTTEEWLEEQWDTSGMGALYDDLPPHTQRLLATLGMDGMTLESLTSMTPQTVLSAFGELVSEELSPTLASVLTMLGTVLLSGVLLSLKPVTGEHGAVMQAVGTLCATAPLLLPLWQVLERVGAAADSAATFSLGFAPVYAGMLLTSGFTTTAVSYQTVMLAAAEGISLLVSGVILPLLGVAVALSVAGAADTERTLSAVGGMVGKAAAWLLGISLTVFVAVLSFQSILSACADSVGGRMLRFSVSGFVPIVGGSLSEALYTVKGCLTMLRGSAGACGVLCAAAIVLPTLVQCVLWNVLLFPVKLTAELFGLSAVASVTEVVRSAVKTGIAVLCSSLLLMIISLTVIAVAGGGAG